MSPFFSIVVPVYNVEEYLQEAVDSVLMQNFFDYEIILIDDGSTDASRELVDEIAATDDRIIVIHQKNQGLSAARNSGMKIAKGRYIVFLDSDDCLSMNALNNLQKNLIDSNYPDFVISRRETMRTTGHGSIECGYWFEIDRLRSVPIPSIYDEIQNYPDMWMGAWIFTISKDYMLDRDLFFYPGVFHEDEEWVPRVFFANGSIGFNNSLLYSNRPDRIGSITSVPNIKRLNDKLFIVDRLGQIFTNDKFPSGVVASVRKRQCAIVFGVVVDARNYIKVDCADEMFSSLANSINYLKESERLLHKLTYVLCKSIGIYKTSLLLGTVR